MGFKSKRKVYVLQFEDEELEGLEVKAASVDAKQFYELMALFEGVQANRNDADLGKVLVPEFAKVLRSWNLEDDDGTPIPATAEGLMTQELGFVLSVISAWLDALAGVAAPLEKPSSDGEPSPEVSLPMEALSANPTTSLTPV